MIAIKHYPDPFAMEDKSRLHHCQPLIAVASPFVHGIFMVWILDERAVESQVKGDGCPLSIKKVRILSCG